MPYPTVPAGDPRQRPRRSILIRLLPVALLALFALFKYMTAETAVNPETGQVVKVALSPEQEEALGLQSYQQVLSESEVVSSGPEYELIRKIAARLAAATGEGGAGFEWHASLVRNDQVNAFCLPGGKIVVYTGILPVAKTEEGLAAVMGHEMAHATLRHGAQRLLRSDLTNTVMQGVAMSVSDMDIQQQRAVMSALGAGAQFGILMPFGRDHETEADEIGILYMARAGYDPRESVGLWERMAKAGGGQQPPEFMSTHPSHGTRIERLEAFMPRAMKEYQKAVGARSPTGGAG